MRKVMSQRVPAKAIEFDVDIKVLVKGYQAHSKSRFGGNEPYTIWEEGFHRWLLRQNKGKHHATPTAQPTIVPR